MKKIVARGVGAVLFLLLFALASTGKGGWVGALIIFAVVGICARLVFWVVENWDD